MKTYFLKNSFGSVLLKTQTQFLIDKSYTADAIEIISAIALQNSYKRSVFGAK